MQQSERMIHIAAISGSLRAASVNSAVLRVAAKLAPEHIRVSMLDDVGGLPLFNPDLDNEAAPESVHAFRRKLVAVDGVLIACPEYAHGVPGAMKNALDWIVASGELVNKPVALLNAAPRARIAQAALLETLTVMTANIITAASLTLPITIKNITQAQIHDDLEVCKVLKKALNVFCAAIHEQQAAS